MSEFTESDCKQRVDELPEYLRAVLTMMARGQCTKEIASELNLTPSTVYVYRERVYSRLAVNNLATATRIAVAAKIV
jgi:DNA-binding NarL/FixJ family response regulator